MQRLYFKRYTDFVENREFQSRKSIEVPNARTQQMNDHGRARHARHKREDNGTSRTAIIGEK